MVCCGGERMCIDKGCVSRGVIGVVALRGGGLQGGFTVVVVV